MITELGVLPFERSSNNTTKRVVYIRLRVSPDVLTVDRESRPSISNHIHNALTGPCSRGAEWCLGRPVARPLFRHMTIPPGAGFAAWLTSRDNSSCNKLTAALFVKIHLMDGPASSNAEGVSMRNGSSTTPIRTKLGARGAPEIAAHTGKVLITVRHSTRVFVNELPFVTSVGYGAGGHDHERLGMPGAGPTEVITDLGILEPEQHSHEFILIAVHPGITVDQVSDATGWLDEGVQRPHTSRSRESVGYSPTQALLSWIDITSRDVLTRGPDFITAFVMLRQERRSRSRVHQ